MTIIFDSLFRGQQAVHASDGRFGAAPASVIWEPVESVDRARLEDAGVIWATDGRIGEMVRATEGLSAKRVGWLLEPDGMHPENYLDAMRHIGFLDLLFVNDVDFHREAPRRTLEYPMGGTRLHPSHWRFPGDAERPPDVSLILSDKRTLPGHKFRHDLAEALLAEGAERPIMLYGPSYKPIASKAAGLLMHDYTFAIEPVSVPGWFTEHLIDPMLAGVVPIWNGSLSTLRRWGFDDSGVILCGDLAHALAILDDFPKVRSEVSREAVRRNFVKAHEYTCTEDWLHREYGDWFDE